MNQGNTVKQETTNPIIDKSQRKMKELMESEILKGIHQNLLLKRKTKKSTNESALKGN